MAVQPQEAIRPLTVLELNTRIHDLLAARFQSVAVKGEVSGVSVSRGHVWFTLKDPGATVGAVIFSSTARRLPFLPENGQELVATCQVDFHAQSGRLNLVVSRLDYDGVGKLKEAIEQLKRRLDAEGAFSQEHKRALPFLPGCIALITSPGGAVIHDLQQTIWERFPNVRLVVYPAQVQGMASQRSLVAALRQCDADAVADVCIVARGGGSFEELMAFNQEAVVRAIQAVRMPVVTALGHTSDRTLADLVADREARTPTAAAELVVPVKADLMRLLADRGQRLQRAGMAALVRPAHQLETRARELGRLGIDVAARRKDHLAGLERMLRQRDPREVLRLRQRSLAEAGARYGRMVAFVQARFVVESARVGGLVDGLTSSASRTVHDRARGLESREQRLRSLGPQETLKRGYSICLDQDGRTVIRDAAQSAPGRQVEVVLAAGRLDCTVERTKP